jgi:heterotetrameric sarcosine oxidase gamma subunit
MFRSSIETTLPRQETADLALADESALSKWIVRAPTGSGAAEGLATPFGSSSVRNGTLIAATRPDEWLLLGSVIEIEDILQTLPAAGPVTLVDWTHARAVLRLTGQPAPRALEKVCGLDWSDDMTPDGAVTSASVAKVTCDVVRNDLAGVPSYLILCDRSFGQYLYDALADAAAEFGVGGMGL